MAARNHPPPIVFVLLFGLQASLGSDGWLAGNLRIAGAILLGSLAWIAVLTLLGLAVSAWIRWRLVASAALFGIFFMGIGFGEAWREVLGSPWGRLANLVYMIGVVWTHLFGTLGPRSLAHEMLDDRRSGDLPLWAAWLALSAVCALSLWLLNRRLRAREVVS